MLDSSKVLILRSCHAGFKAHGGFQWPCQVGAVVTPERWNSSTECGNGLHGFLKGEGCGSLADWSETAEWLVVEADTASVVNLGGEKVKVPRCTIAHVGQGDSAVAKRIDCLTFMASKGQLGEAPIGRVAQALGYGSTLTGGYRSTLTGGDGSTLTGGDGSTLTGGDHSTLLFKFWHGSKGRFMRKMFTVGEDDCVVAGVKYRMNDAGILEQV